MTVPSLTIVSDPDKLAARAADHFLEITARAVAERGRGAVALAGGSTPRAMNALLAASPRHQRLDWRNVDFYFGDERCVPPDHPDSNYRMTRETLFAPLGIAEGAIFRIAGEDEPHVAAEHYEALLRKTLGTPPVFDLVALGMGPDGHTASLFPGTLGGISADRSVVANFVPKFATYRITITPAVLAAARHIMITAAGAEKADSLNAVIDGPYDPDRYPAQLLRNHPGDVRWFVDAAAAEKLAG